MSKWYRLENLVLNVFFKAFDSYVQTIVLYGAEIYAIETSSCMIEKVHLFGMKKMLGVRMRTPNDLVNAELGGGGIPFM